MKKGISINREGIDMNNNWKFCVVGNIVKQHLDEGGNVLYGTRAFSGNTKVYICDSEFDLQSGMITVLGLNRFGRYSIERIYIGLIVNVRLQKVFKPKVLEIMDSYSLMEGMSWRGRTAEDRRTLEKFVEYLKEYQ